MEIKEIKTLVMELSYKELKQLALVGINAVMQTSFVENDGPEFYKDRYREIAKSCDEVSDSISTTLLNVKLSDYDVIDPRLKDK